MDALSSGAVNATGQDDVALSGDAAAAATGRAQPGPEAVCTEEVCITCSDEGRVAEVTAVREDGRAEVLCRGRQETVDASLVDVAPGDLVLVHAGVALSVVELPTATGPPERRSSFGPPATVVVAGRLVEKNTNVAVKRGCSGQLLPALTGGARVGRPRARRGRAGGRSAGKEAS